MAAEDGPKLRRQVRRPGSPRPHVHRVKVTAEQEAQLVAKAEAQGWTVPRLMVESALAGGADTAAAKASLAGDLFGVMRVLGRVANNVNQLAKATNATGQVQPGTKPALDALTRLEGRLTGLLDQMEYRS